MALTPFTGELDPAPPTPVAATLQPFTGELDAAHPDVGVVQGLGAGLLRGAKDVVDTGAHLLASGFDKLAGTKEGERVAAMNDAGKAEFQQQYGGSTAADIGRVGGQIAATLPVGGALGAGVKAIGAAGVAPQALVPLGEAIASGGLSAQGAGLVTRTAGGAISGGATAGLVDPNEAAAGAAIGAALPTAVRAGGQIFNRLGRAMGGADAPAGIQQAAAAGAEQGLVVPPTMVNPSLVNRAIEGYAGKASVAQQASAKNQGFINKIAAKAIGAEDLSPESIAAVRARANQAYDDLGRAGTFQTDDAFRNAMEKVGASSSKLKQDFPEVVSKNVEALVDGFSNKAAFDAQSGIEAIKRLRASATANKSAFGDPEKLALGRVQSKISDALENLIDRNLTASGDQQLLGAYRNARQTLAKTYDVERATNPATGNIDGRKLVAALKKGRLSGDLKSIGEFSAAFPKAVQSVEQIGSQPGVSPLDFGLATGVGAASGSPLAALGLMGRPFARAVALSQPVQRKLATTSGSSAGLGLPKSRSVASEALLRGLPVGLAGLGQ